MPTKRSPIFLTSQSRVWLIPNRAGPGNVPEYQSYARGGSFSWGQGSLNPIYSPSDEQYSRFDVIGSTVDQAELPQLNVEWRSTRQRSDILDLVRGGCPFDVQIHIGTCQSPLDFDFGAEKILVLEGGHLDTYNIPDIGAFDKGQEAPGQENSQITGLDWYEILNVRGAEVAAAEVINPIVAISVCDSKSCGECGLSSDGCQVVFALAKSTGGSPGLEAKVVFTSDGGATWDVSRVTTLPAGTNPNHGTCVGTNYVLVSNANDALHYAPIADILSGDEAWVKVTTGIVGAGSPNKMFSLGRVFTWIVGDGGYIYFSADITAGVDVQTAGSVTSENLAAIHGVDRFNLVAVGANNVVLNTQNGGSTWSLITGPAAGVALTAVWMLSEGEWLVGTAGGKLFYTVDSGANWTEKAFTSSGDAVAVSDIKFPKPTVGYMSHGATVLRTKNGGNTWYALPEQAGLSFPSATSYDALGVCDEDANLVFAGGTGTSDGILVKAA